MVDQNNEPQLSSNVSGTYSSKSRNALSTKLIGWGLFALGAAVWVFLMVEAFTTRATLTSTSPVGEIECYALSDAPSLDYYSPNVMRNTGSAADQEFQKRKQGYYPGADVDNALLRHELHLWEDRTCEAQRASDAAKLTIIGVIGGVTLTLGGVAFIGVTILNKLNASQGGPSEAKATNS